MDPFASVGTSNVFFQLVLGRTTPTRISESLEDQQPPSVMEHLNKLREKGVIDRGEKDGTYQPYEIDWKKFVDEFLEHISTPKRQKAAIKLEEDADVRKELQREQKLMKEVMDELRRSERFRDVLKGYFERLTEDMDKGLYPRRTIWGAIHCFEESLPSVISAVGKVTDPEVKKLLSLLEKWDRCARRFTEHGPRAAFVNSIKTAKEGVVNA